MRGCKQVGKSEAPHGLLALVERGGLVQEAWPRCPTSRGATGAREAPTATESFFR